MRKETAKNLLRIIPAAFMALLAVSCEKDATTVTDIDGNVYSTVAIGNQVWMASDLKTTKYRDGSVIPVVTDNNAWASLPSGAVCDYNNDASISAVYGKLYNWYAVNDTRGLCPAGWHVPSDSEITSVVDALGGDDIAGGKMKEAGTAHWSSPNGTDNNESGFTALGGGYRNFQGVFKDKNYKVGYWSSTSQQTLYSGHLSFIFDAKYSEQYGVHKNTGFYIRCVQDK
jgi:uncharacterized protein (TIGR02145 family)